jgi:hypothetical protein
VPELVCSADDPRWLEERRRGVTATEIVAIIGLAPEAWEENAYSLYHKKLGLIPDVHQDNDRLRLGKELEPLIIERFKEATGRVWAFRDHLWRSTVRPWQLATPDCLMSVNKLPAQPEPFEAKSWADADRDSWAVGPPPQVRAQVLWQMDTLDVARGHVGVLFLPSGEFRSYVISHEDTYAGSEWGCNGDTCTVCADQILMRDAGRDFLDRVDLRDPPSLDGSGATLAALRARFAPLKGKEAEIDAAEWEEYLYCKRWAEAAEADVKNAEAHIREQLGEATILTVGGTKVATRITGESPVKAHTRRMDYIRRTPKKGEAQ